MERRGHRDNAQRHYQRFLELASSQHASLVAQVRERLDRYSTQDGLPTNSPSGRFYEGADGDIWYAIDAGRVTAELGWRPRETFATGLRKTVEWYLGNPDWVAAVKSGAYRDWLSMHYAGALA